MPVLELAILPLLSGVTATSPAVLSKLRHLSTAQKSASGFPVQFLQQVEDPSLIYLLGGWSSVATHNVHLLTAENLAVLELFRDIVDIPTIVMFHVNVTPQLLPQLVEAKIVSVNRQIIKEGQEEQFEAAFGEAKNLLEKYTKPVPVIGGWKVEEEEGKKEFVLLSGFESVEHHFDFAKTENFEKFKTISDFRDKFEIKHLQLVNDI